MPTDSERNARELLAKWNAQNLMAPTAAARPVTETPDVSTPAAERDSIPATVNDLREHAAPRARKDRVDPSETDPRLSERDAEIVPRMPAARASGWGSTVGQMCAYFGIGLITCGTSVVLWGYFGGPANFAPTGWLITTIGQMFLFLGVVTLISSGMEQTTLEVAERIEVLGQRLIRIESRQLRHALTGPHERRSRRRPSSSSQADDLAAEPS